ncbi:alpha/beta fold hydrolase [Peribacillus sp. NPDC096448]|uniref:alpha/beta fold hydrolase n=1 Tax=Peribacillus sp. NPDC096448 TaxID=3364395 RepID=UPI003819386A
MEPNGQILQLNDGRKLGYIQYGKKDGIPIFLFHGTPGSRIWFLDDDEVSNSLGIRLISIDRPGYGLSDLKPNRTVLDWTDDVEELANHLQIENFSVIGVSGGGAYAAACGYKIPQRINSITMVSSVTPFKDGKPPKAMVKENRIAFWLSKNAPWILKLSYKSMVKIMDKSPDKFKKDLKNGNKHLTDWDRQFLQTDEHLEATFRHLREAYRNQVDEGATEPYLLSKYWGFDLKDIKVPVYLFHGEEDRMAPVEEIKKVSRIIPECQLHLIPDAGHFLTDDSKIWGRILREVIIN